MMGELSHLVVCRSFDADPSNRTALGIDQGMLPFHSAILRVAKIAVIPRTTSIAVLRAQNSMRGIVTALQQIP